MMLKISLFDVCSSRWTSTRKIDAFYLSQVLALMFFQWMVFAVSFADSTPGPMSITSNNSNQLLNRSYSSHHHLVGVNNGNVESTNSSDAKVFAAPTSFFSSWWLWVTCMLFTLLICGVPIMICYFCGVALSSCCSDAKEEKGKTGKEEKAKTNKEGKAKTGKEGKVKTNKEGKPPAAKHKAKTNKA